MKWSSFLGFKLLGFWTYLPFHTVVVFFTDYDFLFKPILKILQIVRQVKNRLLKRNQKNQKKVVNRNQVVAPQIIIKDPNLITKVVSIVTKVPTLTRIVILKGLVQGEIPFKIFLRVDHIKIINREPKKIGNIFQKKMIYKSWSLMLISR